PPDDGESTASTTEWIGRGLLVLYSLDRDHRARALHLFERREIQSFVREHFSAQVAGQPGVRIGGAPGRRNLKNALSSKLGCEPGADETIVDVVLRRRDQVVDGPFLDGLLAMPGKQFDLQNRQLPASRFPQCPRI